MSSVPTCLVLAACLALSLAFPNGAPNCKVTVPRHSAPPQDSFQPYELTATQTSDRNFFVEIGFENATEFFKGFLVMATNPEVAGIGHWVIPREFQEDVKVLEQFNETDSQFYPCGVTHTNRIPKDVVQARFETKGGFHEHLDPEFMAIMVKDMPTFWVDIPIDVGEVHLTD